MVFLAVDRGFGQLLPTLETCTPEVCIVALRQIEYGVYRDLIIPNAIFYLLKGDYNKMAFWAGFRVLGHGVTFFPGPFSSPMKYEP